MNEVVSKNELKPDAEAVRTLIEEMAESYEKPEDVVKWYYSDKEQLANVEAMALEDAVIDLVLNAAKVKELSVSYEEALKPLAPKAEEKSASKKDEIAAIESQPEEPAKVEPAKEESPESE